MDFKTVEHFDLSMSLNYLFLIKNEVINMVEAKCVLGIMIEKNYIKMVEIEEYCTNDINVYGIEVTDNIHDYGVREVILSEIIEKIEKDDEYVIAVRYRNGSHKFVLKEDLKRLVQNFLDLEVERFEIQCIPTLLREWINDNYWDVSASDGYTRTILQNLPMREAREEAEEESDRKALELLENIL